MNVNLESYLAVVKRCNCDRVRKRRFMAAVPDVNRRPCTVIGHVDTNGAVVLVTGRLLLPVRAGEEHSAGFIALAR